MSGRSDRRSRRSWRTHKRRQSHAEASAEPLSRPDIPDHPLICGDDPRLVDTQDGLTELLDHVREQGACAYDTEFIGEAGYFPRLCLVQIATAQRVAVIDALASIDVTPLWRLLTDGAVLKILHAGQQDLEPALRHTGECPANVFDTQVAAGFVRLPYPLSLSRLLRAVIGVKLGKSMTFTSWDQRPVSPAHLHYAADDVRFLPAVHEAMCQRLAETGRTDWALQQCAALCQPEALSSDLTQTTLRIRGAKGMDRKSQAVLHELVKLRDELAQQHDVPPRTLIRDEALTAILKAKPKTPEALLTVRGLSKPIAKAHGAAVCAAVDRGREAKRPPWPKIKTYEESPAEQFHVDGLWAAVQSYCHAQSVDPSLVGTRGDVAAWHRAQRRGADRELPLLTGWRAELLGEFLPTLRGADEGGE